MMIALTRPSERILRCVWLSVLALLLSWEPQVFAAEVGFEKPVLDLGIVHDEVLESALTLVNRSERSVRLEGVKSSCGCTIVDWEPCEITAGGSTTLRSKINAATRQGLFEVSVAALFESGATSTCVVRGWRSATTKPIVVSPPRLYLGWKDASGSSLRTFIIEAPSQLFHTLAVRESNARFKVTRSAMQSLDRYDLIRATYRVDVVTNPAVAVESSYINIVDADHTSVATVAVVLDPPQDTAVSMQREIFMGVFTKGARREITLPLARRLEAIRLDSRDSSLKIIGEAIVDHDSLKVTVMNTSALPGFVATGLVLRQADAVIDSIPVSFISSAD